MTAIAALSHPSAIVSQHACGFLADSDHLLNLATVACIAVPVALATWKVLFARKRMSEVANVVTVGLLLGAAAQIVRALLVDSATCIAGLAWDMPRLLV